MNPGNEEYDCIGNDTVTMKIGRRGKGIYGAFWRVETGSAPRRPATGSEPVGVLEPRSSGRGRMMGPSPDGPQTGRWGQEWRQHFEIFKSKYRIARLLVA